VAGPPSDAGPDKSSRSIYELYDRSGFPWLLRRLERDERPRGDEVAGVLEANEGTPIPPPVLEYICRLLRGEVRQKRGPKRKESAEDTVRATLAAVTYREKLREFTEEAANAQTGTKSKDDDLSARERALQYVCDQFYRKRNISPGRLHNLLSERGLLQSPRQRDHED